MNIPKKLKVGGHTITIDCSKVLRDRSGEWDAETLTIRICKSLPASQKEVTLLHELFHAMNAEWDLTHIGHMAMESLSQQLYQVLKDNKLKF